MVGKSSSSAAELVASIGKKRVSTGQLRAMKLNPHLLMLGVMLIAAFFRLFHLPALPPGLNFDEAGSGVAALDILHGSPRLWWRLGGGQEPLWPYLAALTTALLGNIPLALRLPAVWGGLLTIAAVYPLVQLLSLGNRRQTQAIAFLTALGLALSSWHLHFSRLGFRAILLPLLSTLAFYFLWRSLTNGQSSVVSPTGRLRTRQWLEKGRTSVHQSRYLDPYVSRFTFHSKSVDLILSALCMALAIYTYLAARLLPLVLLLFIGLHWLINHFRPWSGQGRARAIQEPKMSPSPTSHLLPLSLLHFFAFFLLFLLPLIIYFSFNQADFMARSATVSIFNPDWNQGDLIGTAWRTLALTLGTLVGLTGDPNPLVNLPGQPALPLLLAPFFMLGLATSLYRAFTPSSPQPLTSAAHLFLLCWWSVMLLPALLAPEGAPHHLRLLGMIVPTHILVAIGFITINKFLSKVVLSTLRPGLLDKICTVHPNNDSRTEKNTDKKIKISVFPSVRESKIWLRLRRVTFYVLEPKAPYGRFTSLWPLVFYALVGWQTYTHYFTWWPARVDFTLPFDLYAVRLAGEINDAPAKMGYVLPMDIRAVPEARHYTLDYLLSGRPEAATTYIPVDENNAETLLTQAARGKDQLRVVRWTEDKHREADAKEMVIYLLETTAQLSGRDSFPVYDLETYALPPQGNPDTPLAFTLPAINQPVGVTFDGLLRLEAAFVPSTVQAGEWLPVALTLAPVAPMTVDYKASLRLLGPTGERLTQKDRVLLHNFHQGTSLWPPETVNEYYLLPVPRETPPGEYTVAVVIYHPETQAPLVADGVVEVPVGKVRVE